jgi:hypothetical protein
MAVRAERAADEGKCLSDSPSALFRPLSGRRNRVGIICVYLHDVYDVVEPGIVVTSPVISPRSYADWQAGCHRGHQDRAQ